MSDPLFLFSPGEETILDPDELRLESATAYAGVGRSVMLSLINRGLVKIKSRRLPDARGITRRIVLVNRKSIDRLFESRADGRKATWRE
jgi:hypothetical protein